MRGSSPQGLPSAIRRGARVVTCDPSAKSPFGIGLFLLMGVFASALPWTYHNLIIPVWAYIDPANVPGPSSIVWAGIGSVTVMIVQGIVTVVNRRYQHQETEAEAERQFKREMAKAQLDSYVAQLDKMKTDMEQATREVRRKEEQAEAERRRLAQENETLKRRVSELEKTVPPIEARAADTAAKTAVIQAEILKQNILPKADPNRPPDAPRHTLVIAEDEPAWVGQLSGDFFGLGFDVRTAVTLAEALALIEKAPHFAIVDLKLAGEDGMQIIQAIRDKGLHTEVVVFTAADDERLDRAIEVVGRERVIQKGSKDAGDRLIALIKSVMNEKRRQAGV
jgi:ActR/RegA family two-component response regulator